MNRRKREQKERLKRAQDRRDREYWGAYNALASWLAGGGLERVIAEMTAWLQAVVEQVYRALWRMGARAFLEATSRRREESLDSALLEPWFRRR